MKIDITAFEPMLKANEHLAHGSLTIDLGDNIVAVIRCKDCGYFHENRSFSFCDRPCEAPVQRFPDDFCSRGVRKDVQTKSVQK